MARHNARIRNSAKMKNTTLKNEKNIKDDKLYDSKPKSKYRANKCVYDGIKFDSNREMSRYIDLKLLEQAGTISDLKLQVKFELQPSYEFNGRKIRAITYVADFTYRDNRTNEDVVEDSKGFRTEVYKLKKKMFEYLYKIEIKEV